MAIEDTGYFQTLLKRVGENKGPLSQLEERVVRRGVGGEFGGVPWEWVERGDEGEEIVNLILAAMDGVRVKWVDGFGEDDDGQDSFRLEVVEKPDRRAKDKDRLWPEMILCLRQGRFSYLEMPALLRQVEDAHNQWLVDEGWPEELRVNLVEVWSQRWRKSVEIMGELRGEVREVLGEEGEKFLDQARMMVGIVSRMFDGVAETEVSLENELWERELKTKLEAMISRRKERDYSSDGKRERLGKAVRKLTTKSIKEGLEEEFYELMLEKGMAMMIVKSDLREEIKEAFLNREKMVREGQGDLLKVLLGEGAEVKSFEKLQQELIEVRQSGDVKRVSELELEAVNRFVAVFYAEKVWQYGKDRYRLVDVFDKEINCMAIAALEKAVLEKMLGVRMLGGMSRDHMFGVVSLADGRLLGIDMGWSWLRGGEDSILTVDKLKKRVNYFGEDDLRGTRLNPFGFRLIGDFGQLYLSGVMNWVMERDIFKVQIKQRLGRVINRLVDGKSPDYVLNMALYEGVEKRAKRLFELALEKDERPKTIMELMLLNERLMERGEEEDRERLWQEQIDLLRRLKLRYDRSDMDMFWWSELLKNDLRSILESFNHQLSEMKDKGYRQEVDRLVELNLSLSEYLSIDGEDWEFWRTFLRTVYNVYSDDRDRLTKFVESHGKLTEKLNQDHKEKVQLIMFLFDLRGKGIEVSEEMVELIFDYLTDDDVILVANSTKSLREDLYYDLSGLVISLEDDIEKLADVSLSDRKKFWELLSGRLPNDWLERKELKELKSSLVGDY